MVGIRLLCYWWTAKHVLIRLLDQPSCIMWQWPVVYNPNTALISHQHRSSKSSSISLSLSVASFFPPHPLSRSDRHPSKQKKSSRVGNIYPTHFSYITHITTRDTNSLKRGALSIIGAAVVLVESQSVLKVLYDTEWFYSSFFILKEAC